tara:strand:+ start:1041 stop:2156 length:1116 start_codon:yes stop_codon:yes gene_type:complete
MAESCPENTQGKLDQSNGIKDNPREPYYLDPSQNAPWPVYETYDDLETLKDNIRNTDELYSNTIVVVIDDQGVHNLGYPGTPKFFTSIKTRLGYLRFRPLIIWGIKRKKNIDDIAKNKQQSRDLGLSVVVPMNMSEKMEYIRVNAAGAHPNGTPDTRCGVPYIVPNPDLDYSRPPGVTASTSSATTGVTVETKTVNDPKTAGTVTTTEISVADQVNNLKVGDIATPEQMRYMAQGAPALKPCLPDTTGTGSGSVAPAPNDGRTPAAIALAAAKKAASGIGSLDAAAAAATTTVVSPTVVTTTRAAANGTAPAPDNSRPPNVYIYKAMETGLDRYDFNTGKKVFTLDSGPSIEAVEPTPTTAPNANATIGPQ